MSIEEFTVFAPIVCIVHFLPHFLSMPLKEDVSSIHNTKVSQNSFVRISGEMKNIYGYICMQSMCQSRGKVSARDKANTNTFFTAS
jgi:hypothetical protein